MVSPGEGGGTPRCPVQRPGLAARRCRAAPRRTAPPLRQLLQLTALCMVAAALLRGAEAFKEQDFKKCRDASFCARLRGVSGGGRYSVPRGSISVSGAVMSARLVSKDAPAGHKGFNLTLVSLGGTVRLLIDELGTKRYHVPDVLLPASLAAAASPWASPGVTRGAWRAVSGPATALELGLSPFRLAVTVRGKQALLLNSRSLFAFEHRRAKTVWRHEGPILGLHAHALLRANL
jgi:alpha 1,3-glucosidase